jgi:hypothetical protein
MISTALPSQPEKNPTPEEFDRLALEGNVDPEVGRRSWLSGNVEVDK